MTTPVRNNSENYLEHPILAAPFAPLGQQVPPQALAAHAALVKGQKEVAELMLLTMDLEIQQNLVYLGAYDMLQELKAMYSKQAEQELLQTMREFHTRKQEDGQSGLQGSKKLKPGALSLYVGDVHRASIEAIGTYHLELPSGLVIVLNNCHYAPSITRVSKNNLVYFMAVPRDGIFEIDMSCSNTNDSSMYAVTNKRVKINLDFSLLWHCRLGHISKKRIEKLQHDGLLNSIDIESLGKCVSCMSGKMERKPYSHQMERAKDLLRLIYTDEVENQLRKTVKSLRSDRKDLKASGCVEDLKLQEEDMNPSVDTSLNHEKDNQEIDEPQSDINLIRKSSRTRCGPDRMCLYIDTKEHELRYLDEPTNYKAALLDHESKKWLDAMNVEMQFMKDNDVWVLVKLPSNAKTVGSKWFFKKNTVMDGVVYIFKARLVAKGFTQTYGVDYEETFSPVADIRAIRILIAIVAYYDYVIWKMDVKTAFLNGQLSEEVYMEQPEGFVNPKYPNHKFVFTSNPDEPCVYLKSSGSYIAILILYVDDLLLMGNNIPMLQDVKSYLGRSFSMKDLGEAVYILEIKIYRDRSKRLIGLCQKAYIEKILKRYYMENSKRGTILMQEKLKLSNSQGASTPAEKQRMQNTPYASDVGSIMYGARCTRPDVAERELRVSCYTDAGYLTVADNLKSQTGYVFVLNGGVVDWKSTKQSIFATSSINAEYIAAFDASKEAVWIRKFISRLGIVLTIEEPICMYCDNTRAISIAKDDGVTKGARHFRAKVHYLRETIKLGDVKIEKIDTDDNLADPFTKDLAFLKHSELTRNIGLLPASSFM
nr:hypothetical protein [Tanacetum cinerariifolium]